MSLVIGILSVPITLKCKSLLGVINLMPSMLLIQDGTDVMLLVERYEPSYGLMVDKN